MERLNFYSLISTHAFRLSLANCTMKPIELDEKISVALFTFVVQIFQLLQTFLAANSKPIRFLSLVTWKRNGVSERRKE